MKITNTDAVIIHVKAILIAPVTSLPGWLSIGMNNLTIFMYPAVTVTIQTNMSSINVTHTYFVFPLFRIYEVPATRAAVASN